VLFRAIALKVILLERNTKFPFRRAVLLIRRWTRACRLETFGISSICEPKELVTRSTDSGMIGLPNILHCQNGIVWVC